MRYPRPCLTSSSSSRKLVERTLRRLRSFHQGDPGVDAYAVKKDITSFGTFLSTLCHEYCHHLDFQHFKFPDSWHTRGFYERAAVLYHHARGTAPKRLFWAPISS